jgi:hypothetical protein
MRSLSISRFPSGPIFGAGLALFVIGLFIFFWSGRLSTKSPLSTVPLFWLFVVVFAPLLNAAVVGLMWKQPSPWKWPATILVVLQFFLLWPVLSLVIHYLG